MHCTCLMPVVSATPLATPTTRPNPDGTVTVTPPPFETTCTRCGLLTYVHTTANGDPTFQRFYSPAVLGEPVLRVKLLHPLARPPHRATEGSSGLDLYSVEDVVIPSLVKAIATTSALMLEGVAVTRVRTGLAMAVPRGWEVQVRNRSGVSNKGLIIPNGLGTVDSDYRGEVLVAFINLSGRDYQLKAGDRIAQAVVCPVGMGGVVISEELGETGRGEGGWGSSGG